MAKRFSLLLFCDIIEWMFGFILLPLKVTIRKKTFEKVSPGTWHFEVNMWEKQPCSCLWKWKKHKYELMKRNVHFILDTICWVFLFSLVAQQLLTGISFQPDRGGRPVRGERPLLVLLSFSWNAKTICPVIFRRELMNFALRESREKVKTCSLVSWHTSSHLMQMIVVKCFLWGKTGREVREVREPNRQKMNKRLDSQTEKRQFHSLKLLWIFWCRFFDIAYFLFMEKKSTH